MIYDPDIFSVIFCDVTLREILTYKLVSKLFNEMISRLFPDNQKNTIKKLFKLFDIIGYIYADTRPFIFDQRLLCHDYYKFKHCGIFDYTANGFHCYPDECSESTTAVYLLTQSINEYTAKRQTDRSAYISLYHIENNVFVKNDLIVLNDFEFGTDYKILFVGVYYILIRSNSDRIDVYVKNQTELWCCCHISSQCVCVNEAKDELIYVESDQIMKYYINDDVLLILDEQLISFKYSMMDTAEINYIITKTSDNFIVFRLTYFDTVWKIFEVKTAEFNYNWAPHNDIININTYDSVDGSHSMAFVEHYLNDYFISYSINLGIICLTDNHRRIIYSIKLDKVIDVRKVSRYFGENFIELVDFNEYIYSYLCDGYHYSRITKRI